MRGHAYLEGGAWRTYVRSEGDFYPESPFDMRVYPLPLPLFFPVTEVDK